MVFRYGDSYLGFVTLAAEAVLLPVAAGLGLYIWPRTPMGRRLILRRVENDGSTLAANPIFQELEQLRGRIGKATSVLRPSGVVEFDGRRVDCMSEGILIEPETWVRCIDVKAGHVIVRPIDGPDLKDFETETFA